MMCLSNGHKKAISDAMDVPELCIAAAGSEMQLRLELEAPEPFDLYQWALEFSRAAGFEVETAES